MANKHLNKGRGSFWGNRWTSHTGDIDCLITRWRVAERWRNISRYSHHFPCQSQHVLIRKYVSSKWPCSNRKSYNWINKSKQQTRLVPSVTPCTSKKHPLANCPCIFVRTTVIRSRFVISCGLHSPAARWVWTSSIRVSKWWRDSWIHLPTLARLDEWSNNRNISNQRVVSSFYCKRIQ